MAHYLVRGRPKPDRVEDLRRRLEEGAFAHMNPFGRELTRSLRRARVRDDGEAVWEEEDYCSPPLAQEREAVLDEYFTDLEWKRVEEGEGWDRVRDLPSLFPELPAAPE